MTAKFNFDFTGKSCSGPTAQPTIIYNDSKYKITNIGGDGAPEKVEINLNPICKFDAYSLNDYGIISKVDNNCIIGISSLQNLFSFFGNSQNTDVMYQTDENNQPYCRFLVDMNPNEDCSSLKYCDSAGCDAKQFRDKNQSPITSANTTFIPSGTISFINITCPSSPTPISYSFQNFTPTFDPVTSRLTFTLKDNTTGVQTLGGGLNNTNSIATDIANAQGLDMDVAMNFVCENGKLHSNWGEITDLGCNPAVLQASPFDDYVSLLSSITV